ncbi:hypothetical protein GQ43DRAFT_149989 [Delitschia confertaspora ATCC 74209]|uniref:Uncharacterized protein n=1 Tax=Delitschia confertaspora ATCC 74209 TaxID=1513339 RepID=A0A9P4JK55_9PLEO|nr:hypothetical protein GQ43DRAFT_149989 [Delitschia confertaspora ATCC 74209]
MYILGSGPSLSIHFSLILQFFMPAYCSPFLTLTHNKIRVLKGKCMLNLIRDERSKTAPPDSARFYRRDRLCKLRGFSQRRFRAVRSLAVDIDQAPPLA